MSRPRKQVLLRLDPAVHDALARWAADDLRSVNAQVEFLLREALRRAGRMPADAGGLPRRGRPPLAPDDGGDDGDGAGDGGVDDGAGGPERP